MDSRRWKLRQWDFLEKGEVCRQDHPLLFDSTPWFCRPSAFSQVIASTLTGCCGGRSCWSNSATCFVQQSSLGMSSSWDLRPSFWAVYYEFRYWFGKCRLRSPCLYFWYHTTFAASRHLQRQSLVTFELRGDALHFSRSACSGLLRFSWLTRCMSG